MRDTRHGDSSRAGFSGKVAELVDARIVNVSNGGKLGSVQSTSCIDGKFNALYFKAMQVRVLPLP